MAPSRTFFKKTQKIKKSRNSPLKGIPTFIFHCTFKTAHKLFILKTSVHKRTFTKPHFVLSLLRNSVLFMIVRSLRFAELSNSHASMKFSNSGTTCELLYHFLPWPFGQALDRLVAVSSMPYSTSTPALSTSSSSRGLTSFEWDISSWGGLHA